jgi:acetolactate synthase-1/2/3 large subunit
LSPSAPQTPTAASRLLQDAVKLGVQYVFTNLGSDHPAFIEAFAALSANGQSMPQIIVCPHEMTALSAAHGFSMITRQAQMVLVHVDVGTQNLGCSVHNAARSRIPVIIVAGLSPTTITQEQTGHRTEFIHYTQDSTRQHEIVSQYMKWFYELRSASMAHEVLARAAQIASSSPQGPVYLTGARELWEEKSSKHSLDVSHWSAPEPLGFSHAHANDLVKALLKSHRPLLITSYLGRQTESVLALTHLVERIGIAVCEVNPQFMNFPGDHPCHIGYKRNSLVDEADLILLLDVDVPWIMSKVTPKEHCALFMIDIDVQKHDLGFWHFPTSKSWQADTLLCLNSMNQQLENHSIDTSLFASRTAWIEQAKKSLKLPDMPPLPDDRIHLQHLCQAVKDLVNEKTILLFESPTATERLLSTLEMNQPGSYFANGGSGLGWGINAAIGAKLAKPHSEVISFVGDGSFIFGVPSSAYWVGKTYGTPQLTIVVNNKGWNAPKTSTLLVHPKGQAQTHDTYWITMGHESRFADIAQAAGGAKAYRVTRLSELGPSLQEAMASVRMGQSAVVDVLLPAISEQTLGLSPSNLKP